MTRDDIYNRFVIMVSGGGKCQSFCESDTTLVEQLLDQFCIPKSTRTNHLHSYRSDNLQILKHFILETASDSDVEVIRALLRKE